MRFLPFAILTFKHEIRNKENLVQLGFKHVI